MKIDCTISICIPALNEENTLRGAVEDILTQVKPFVSAIEIIIVDDGSIDGTGKIADALSSEYPQVQVIHREHNQGIGRAYSDAMKRARGDYFTWFPADHENSAGEFVACLAFLAPKTLVTCHHRGMDSRPVTRRMFSIAYTFLLNTLFGLRLRYYNGLTIFYLPDIKKLQIISEGFFFTAELLIWSVKNGSKVVELPFPLQKRSHGKSTAVTAASLYRITRNIVMFWRIIYLKKKILIERDKK